MTQPISSSIRRCADIGLSAAGLVALTPILAGIGILIKLDSPGPALFYQRRIGKDGKPFYISKFRSMRVHHSGVAVSTTHDKRVTRIGRLLRKTKLDELPQLYNVLSGDMSFIGPRPEVPQYVRLWPRDAARVILSVRPGITDPVSITYRNEADLLAQAEDPERFYISTLLPQKARAYADYIHNRTLITDIRVLVDTIRAVIFS